MLNSVFIPGNTPSSKNSKRWTGKMLINSKTVMEYKAKTKIYWIQNKAKFQQMLVGLDKPYKIAFFFVRNSARAFDYVNVAQLPLDLMQEYGWIENDNMLNVLPIFAGYNVDKTKPGVYISVVK